MRHPLITEHHQPANVIVGPPEGRLGTTMWRALPGSKSGRPLWHDQQSVAACDMNKRSAAMSSCVFRSATHGSHAHPSDLVGRTARLEPYCAPHEAGLRASRITIWSLSFVHYGPESGLTNLYIPIVSALSASFRLIVGQAEDFSGLAQARKRRMTKPSDRFSRWFAAEAVLAFAAAEAGPPTVGRWRRP